MADSTERKIVGGISHGNRTYVAGDEEAFAAAMKGKSVEHLVARGKLAGDWSGSPAAAAPDSAADADAPASAAPAARKSARKSGSKKKGGKK